MVVHALNLINPDNWRDAIVQGKAGPIEVREYVPSRCGKRSSQAPAGGIERTSVA